MPHDLRDYDLAISPILTRLRRRRPRTDVVITAGKMGKVYAYRAADGKPLWTRPVGKHQNDTGPAADEYVPVYPGTLGGVETPMALAGRRVFVPWVDLATQTSATSSNGTDPLREGRGGFTALDAATGSVLWQRRLPSMVFGAATVANDVVFTSTYDGTIYAFATATGKQLWTAQGARGHQLVPRRSPATRCSSARPRPASSSSPRFELAAYSLR